MKTRVLIIIISILILVSSIVGLYAANMIKNIEDQKKQQDWREMRANVMGLLAHQKKCNEMGGTWNDDYCSVTQEIFDSNKLTCDPGPVLENGYCLSRGVKLVFEPVFEPKPSKGTITHEKIFTKDGPLQICKIQEDGDKNCGSPVLNEENCVRYTVWLNEFQKEKLHRTDDFPRYPPWGNQIFPLVDYCESVGEFYHVLIEDSTTEIIWSFVPDEQNKDKVIRGFEYMTDKLLNIQEQEDYCESMNAFRTGQNACQYYD